MRPKEVFEKLCVDLKIEHPGALAQAEIIFRAGYVKGKDDEWARILARCEDL